ncbi:MAG: nuclear transport factor 2 family protein [Gemmatimonadaceae bacterium]|nr:nuclear transport factor 2 family protein [Chitinophagaceae bacterium]
MKKTVCLLSAVFCITVLDAQQFSTKSQETVEQTVVKMFDALSSRDSVGLKVFSTADITLFEYGQIWNMDTLILKAITQNKATDFKRTNNFEFISTTLDKATAWLTYRLHSVIIRDGKKVTMQWLETAILVRVKRQWKIKHLHSTLISRS